MSTDVLERPAKGIVRRAFGAGGGKSGGGGGNESDDTLLSNMTAEILDCWSEGPIVGLVDGAKSIYLNGTALQNADNSYNFEGINWEWRNGTEDQDPISIIDDTAVEQSVNVEVTKAIPVTRTVSDDGADAFRVRVRIPALSSLRTTATLSRTQ